MEYLSRHAIYVEVGCKIQTRVNKEFTRTTSVLGHMMFESRKKRIIFFLKSISSTRFLFFPVNSAGETVVKSAIFSSLPFLAGIC